jgi:hypothetical protein
MCAVDRTKGINLEQSWPVAPVLDTVQASARYEIVKISLLSSQTPAVGLHFPQCQTPPLAQTLQRAARVVAILSHSRLSPDCDAAKTQEPAGVSKFA